MPFVPGMFARHKSDVKELSYIVSYDVIDGDGVCPDQTAPRVQAGRGCMTTLHRLILSA